MGWPQRRDGGRHRSLSSNAVVLLLLLFFFAAALTRRCASASRVMRTRDGGAVTPQKEEYTWDDPSSSSAPGARRGLVGPGSSPPTCRSRCGGCHPCRPVHVAIQPGMSFPLEYYPEAWRCKCGNKLFMP